MAVELATGSSFAGYEVEELLGRGGMGAVYRATQRALGRSVALKLIASEYADDDEFRERFKREARLAAQLDHPNVIPVYEAGEADGVLFMSMRYVDGTDLGKLLAAEGRLMAERAAHLIAQLAFALDAAHERGLVHRDVKPANVLVSGRPGEEHAYLTDFGLTKQASSQSGLTQTGYWVGTLDYISPEQLQGARLDARTDVYSLGCLLYQVLTGQVPYPKDSDVPKMWAHISEPPPRCSAVAGDLPPEFDAIVRRAMSKDAAERYPSAGDLGRAALAAAGAAAPAAPPAQPAPAADTRGGTVTFLFTDLVGSTELLDRLGDDGAESVRRTHFGLLREAVVGGRAVKNLGDGLMVAFPSALDAVESAVAMQRAVEKHNRRGAGHPLAVRIGLSVGEPIRDEEDYFGASVVIAKRLCDSAEGGQILASELVRGLVGRRGGHEFSDLGLLELKGLADPVHSFTLAWEPGEDELFPLPPLLARDGRRPFVGRDEQRAELRRHWERARGGGRELVFLGGDPGIGKTRIATEVCLEAHREGAIVLFGRSYEETLVPYQPFIGALKHYVAVCPPERLRDEVGASGAELVTLVPAIAERLPGLEAPQVVDPESERFRLFEAVTSLLARAGDEQPVVLVLDDLHWADKPTLLLLKHLARSERRAPLLVLGTYREADLGRTHPLSETLADLRRDQLAARISLSGLDERETAALIAGWAEHEAPPEFVRAVHRETEGNPFFVEEVIQHLAESGAIYRDEQSGRWTTDMKIEDIGIPEGVKDVIGRRLSRLSDDANRALGIASVVGRTFGLDEVEAVSGMPTEALLDALDEAVRARVIAEAPGAIGRYSFSHALIRETLYEEISATRRVIYHRKIAEAIESAGGDLGPRLSELAYHYLEAAAPAGLAAKAIDFARRAGDYALDQLAFEEASSHYERALAALELKEPRDAADEELRCRLVLARADSHARAGEVPAARESFTRAIELARALGNSELLALAALGFEARALHNYGIVDEAHVTVLEEALSGLGEDDSALRARVLSALAIVLYFGTTRDYTASLSEEALAMARRVGDGAALLAALSARLYGLWDPDHPDERFEIATEMLEEAERQGALEFAAQARLWRFATLLERGDRDALDAEIAEHSKLVDRIRQPFYTLYALAHQGILALLDGRYDDAEALGDQMFELSGEMHNPADAVQVFGAQAMMRMKERRQIAELEEPAKEFAEEYTYVRAWRAAVGLIALDLGQEELAREKLAELAPERCAAVPHDHNLLVTGAVLCEVGARLGEAELLEEVYERLLPYADRVVTAGAAVALYGGLSHWLGVAASGLARHDDAERHFAAAVALHEKLRSPPWIARTQGEWARALLDRGRPGDLERAHELLDGSIETAGRLGQTEVLERSRALKERAEAIAAA